jgi:hypothetical protein
MGLEDRDWYREELRKREAQTPPQKTVASGLKPQSSHKGGRSLRAAWPVFILLFAGLVAIGRDMKDRGVPITWHGFKWWLSLWFGA